MDLIDRQDVIDAVRSYYDEVNTSNKSIEERIEGLPSAQPEKRTEERTETHACDLISRQAAIDALADYIHNIDKVYSTGKLSAYDCKDAAESVIEQLSSVQPEQRWIPCSERLPKPYRKEGDGCAPD